MEIREVIIVEGKDDESAVKASVSAEVIVTNGYGINETVWKRIERAYQGPGIIIFTDPDFAGEQIRRRISERFPEAGHAFISRQEGERHGDIGIENALPETIIRALEKVKRPAYTKGDIFSEKDLMVFGLSGGPESKSRREKLGRSLGIGYGNSKKFLNRLNGYGIKREEFEQHGQALFTVNDKKD